MVLIAELYVIFQAWLNITSNKTKASLHYTIQQLGFFVLNCITINEICSTYGICYNSEVVYRKLDTVLLNWARYVKLTLILLTRAGDAYPSLYCYQCNKRCNQHTTTKFDEFFLQVFWKRGVKKIENY